MPKKKTSYCLVLWEAQGEEEAKSMIIETSCLPRKDRFVGSSSKVKWKNAAGITKPWPLKVIQISDDREELEKLEVDVDTGTVAEKSRKCFMPNVLASKKRHSAEQKQLTSICKRARVNECQQIISDNMLIPASLCDSAGPSTPNTSAKKKSYNTTGGKSHNNIKGHQSTVSGTERTQFNSPYSWQLMPGSRVPHGKHSKPASPVSSLKRESSLLSKADECAPLQQKHQRRGVNMSAPFGSPCAKPASVSMSANSEDSSGPGSSVSSFTAFHGNTYLEEQRSTSETDEHSSQTSTISDKDDLDTINIFTQMFSKELSFHASPEIVKFLRDLRMKVDATQNDVIPACLSGLHLFLDEAVSLTSMACNSKQESGKLRPDYIKVPDSYFVGGENKTEISHGKGFFMEARDYSRMMMRISNPNDWREVVRAILVEVYGENVKWLTAKGRKGSIAVHETIRKSLFDLAQQISGSKITEAIFNTHLNKTSSNRKSKGCKPKTKKVESDDFGGKPDEAGVTSTDCRKEQCARGNTPPPASSDFDTSAREVEIDGEGEVMDIAGESFSKQQDTEQCSARFAPNYCVTALNLTDNGKEGSKGHVPYEEKRGDIPVLEPSPRCLPNVYGSRFVADNPHSQPLNSLPSPLSHSGTSVQQTNMICNLTPMQASLLAQLTAALQPGYPTQSPNCFNLAGATSSPFPQTSPMPSCVPETEPPVAPLFSPLGYLQTL